MKIWIGYLDCGYDGYSMPQKAFKHKHTAQQWKKKIKEKINSGDDWPDIEELEVIEDEDWG